MRVALGSRARRTRRRTHKQEKARGVHRWGLGRGLFEIAVVFCGVTGLERHIWWHSVQGDGLNPVLSAF